MRVLVTGAAGFIGFHVAQKLLARGDEVIGLDNLNPYYDPTLKRRAPRDPPQAVALPLREDRPGRSRRDGSAVCAGKDRARRASRRAGRRALFDPEPARLCRQQPDRHAARARGLPSSRRRAPRLRLDEFGVRRQHEDAVLGAPERGPSAVLLRGDQEGQRTDGAHLRLALRTSGHRPAFLHRLRALGPAGHGAVPVHAQHPRGAADRRLQLRQSPPRFHLHRRHRGGRRRLARPCRDAEHGLGQRRPGPGHEQRALPALQHRQQPARRADALHRGARTSASAARRRRTCCRCRSATCRTPGPTPRTWCAMSATGRRRRSRRACGASSSGISAITRTAGRRTRP